MPPKRRPARRTSHRRSGRGLGDIRARLHWPAFELERHELDLIGLGLAAAAIFLAFIFYFGWDGGKVGESLRSGFVFLFGAVAYAAPVVVLAAAVGVLIAPLLPSLRPARTGTICLLIAFLLGFAAASFGLGGNHPARHGVMHPAYFRHHGGVFGDALYFAAKSL